MVTEEKQVEVQEAQAVPEEETGPRLDIVKSSNRMPYLKIMIYGPPGVGKTVLAGTASRSKALSPVLFADAEAGTLSLKDDIDVVRITDMPTLGKMVKFLRTEKQYKTVVIDSLTEVQKIIMKHVIQQAVKEDPKHDKEIPYQKDWYRNSELVRRIVRSFRDLPMHVIFTALDREVKDDLTGSVQTLPALPGQLAGEVPGYLDIVGYLTVQEVDGNIVRRLIVQPTPMIMAKDRSDALGPWIDNPELSSIVKRIVQSRKPKEEKKE